jgi:hypothetical protein
MRADLCGARILACRVGIPAGICAPGPNVATTGDAARVDACATNRPKENPYGRL